METTSIIIITAMALIIIALVTAILLIAKGSRRKETDNVRAARQTGVESPNNISMDDKNQYDRTVALGVKASGTGNTSPAQSRAKLDEIPRLSNDVKTEILRNINESKAQAYDHTEVMPEKPKPKAAALIRYIEEGQTKEYKMTGDTVNIGRNPELCDLVFNGDNYLGKHHAMLLNKSNKLYLVDLSSKNGTYLDGKRIEGSVELSGSCSLRFANTEAELIIL